MKIVVNKENLMKALSTSLRAVSLKATLPILSNICFITEGSNKVRLSSTNLEMGINYALDSKVEREGSLSVPGRVLYEYVSSLPDQGITLDSAEETLKITSSSGEATISGIASSEFPPVPVLTGEATLFLDPKEFQKAVAQVAFSASTDTSRAVLSGILLQFNADNVVMVATDGYRLSEKVWQREVGVSEKVIIPAKSLYEISRVVAESFVEGEELRVEINKEKNQVLFGLDRVSMATRILDGQYPNYTQIIPQNFVTRVLVDSTAFSNALKTASVLAKDLGSVIKIKFSPTGDITFSSSTNQLGSSTTQIKASVEGEELLTAFNQRFITEALNVIPSTQLSLELSSATHPLVIKGVGESSYLHLIMPVRIQS